MLQNVIEIRLEQVLKDREKSLYWLAKQTGISYNALSKIKKNDVKRLELDTIEKLCVHLDCLPNDLLSISQSH